jgi:hypothetical protein
VTGSGPIATGVTTYLTNGGTLEKAAQIVALAPNALNISNCLPGTSIKTLPYI